MVPVVIVRVHLNQEHVCEVRLPVSKPLALGALADAELNAELKKGLNAVRGRQSTVYGGNIFHFPLDYKATVYFIVKQSLQLEMR
jgi:hypothetical protein